MDKKQKQEYDRKRYLEKKEHYREIHKDYYENNRENLIQYQTDYNQENKKQINERINRWRKINKDIQDAYNKSRGIKIPKEKLCERCNKEKATEKHHPDYNQPKLLIFLCHECHLKEHGRGLKSTK
jgi:hypothetical protein